MARNKQIVAREKQIEEYNKLYYKTNEETGRRVLDEYLEESEISDEMFNYINNKIGHLVIAIKDYDVKAKGAKHKSKFDLLKMWSREEYLNAKDIYGNSLLAYAMDEYYSSFGTDSIKRMILDGADVNTKDYNDKTTLHHFAFDEDMVRFLYENGADFEAKDNLGFTPVYYSDYSTVETFAELGADFNAINEDGISVLMHAIMHQDEDKINTTIDHNGLKHINTPFNILARPLRMNFEDTLFDYNDYLHAEYFDDKDFTPLSVANFINKEKYKGPSIDTELLEKLGAVEVLNPEMEL